MRFLSALSDLMVPVLIFYVVGLGLLMKQDVFGDFLNGAKDGMRTVIGIVPTLIGLMAAVGVLRSSGFLEEFGKLLGTVLEPAGIPSALVPLGVVRLFSNSAAVGLLLDLYKEAGCDSFAGRAASIMMSCTETVFYTMAVYFAAVPGTSCIGPLSPSLLLSQNRLPFSQQLIRQAAVILTCELEIS